MRKPAKPAGLTLSPTAARSAAAQRADNGPLALAVQLFDTVLDPTRTNDALAAVAATLDARGAWLTVLPGALPAQLVLGHSGIDGRTLQRLEQEQGFSALLLGRSGKRLVSGLRLPYRETLGTRQLKALDSWRTILQPLGLSDGTALVVDHSSSFTAVLHVAGRRKAGKAWNRARLESITPLLLRAARATLARASVDQLQRTVAALLGTINLPVAIVDGGGRVVLHNVQAAALRKRDGVALADGRLWLANAQDRRSLDAALRELLRSDHDRKTAEAFEILAEGGVPRRLRLILARIDAEPALPGLPPSVLVSMQDLDARPQISIDRLSALFDLTRGEARVVGLLAEGRSLRQCAEFLNRSPATVRNQLHRVFIKTGVSSQAQLIALILRLTPTVRFGRLAHWSAGTD